MRHLRVVGYLVVMVLDPDGRIVMVGSTKLHFVGSLDREVEPDFAVFEVPTAAHLLTAPIVPATISA
jgi:hypothetical protein